MGLSQDIEDELAVEGQPVVWYVIADMPELRHGLDKRWGCRGCVRDVGCVTVW